MSNGDKNHAAFWRAETERLTADDAWLTDENAVLYARVVDLDECLVVLEPSLDP